MNPKEISLVISLVLPCSIPATTATLTVPVAHQPIRLPDDKPEPLGGTPTTWGRFGRTSDLRWFDRLRCDVERKCDGHHDNVGTAS